MTCFQLGWLILGIIFVAENGQRSVVYGMPVDPFDGSRLCGFKFMGAEEERSHIAFEVVYGNISSVLAKSTNCNMEFWRDATGLGVPPGNKRSLDKLGVQLTRDNPELFKIFVDKETQGWLESNVNSIVRIVCPNWKFNCIRFLSNEKGSSPMRRSLLSIDHLVTEDGIPLKSIFLLLAGAVILIIAVSLCADCNQTKDDESVEEARPELLGCQKRASQRTITPEEKQTDEKTFVESEDVVMETVDKIDGDSLEVNNHQTRTTITYYELPPSNVQSFGAPGSTPPEPPTGTEYGPPVTTETGLPSKNQPVQANGTQPEAESGHEISQALKAGSSKKKHGSDSDNEEHKGRFWKRTRSAKSSTSSGTARSADRTSDAVFQDEEHKNWHSKKDSKELKTKSGKTKRRTSSTDSEKDQKTTLRDEHTERPRETTPTLERPIRNLPLPPGTSSSALPAGPVPQRQFSAPEGEDNTYEQVEVRKTKSMERVKAILPPEFATFDAVQESDGKPRLPSLDHDSPDGIDTGARTSDLYETVDDALTSETGDDLYSEVDKSGNEEAKNEDVVTNKDVIEEDVYSRIKERDGADNSEPNGDEEKSYPENSELYEDVENTQENSDTNHKYSAVDKEEVMRLMIQDGTNTESSERQRSQSDAVVLRRSENELPKRPNTVHVVRTKKGEVTQAEGEAASVPFDYTYAKVDLSKKTRRRRNTEGEETNVEDTWDTDIPPPLPPAYVSSKQIQIEMGRTADLAIDNKENLYDEVAQQDRSPNLDSELLAPADESNRLSSVSDDYELVEVVATPNSPIVRTTEDNYSEVVEREPRSKMGGGRGGTVSVEVCGAPANLSVTVTSSSVAVDGNDGNVENEETSLYEQIERRKERKEPSNLSHGGWV